jgi:hypothetical protein
VTRFIPALFVALTIPLLGGCFTDPYRTLDAANRSDTPVRVDYQPPLRMVDWPMNLVPQERMVFDLSPGERWHFADATPDEIAPGEYVLSPAQCWLKYQFKDKPACVIYLDWRDNLRVEFANDQRVVFYDAEGAPLDRLFWWRQDEIGK